MPAISRPTTDRLGHLAQCAGGAFAGDMDPPIARATAPASYNVPIAVGVLVVIVALTVYAVS